MRGCIAERIKAGWAGEEPPSFIGEASFAELGVDSVRLIEIVYEVECVLDVRFDEAQLLSIETIADLYELAAEARPEAQGAPVAEGRSVSEASEASTDEA